MYIALIVAGVLVVLWLLINLKTSRPDGEHIKKVPKYRVMLGYIMPTRAESVVYFDTPVKAEALLDFIAASEVPCNITHCVVAAAARSLAQNPKLNRFVSGRRMYQRKGIHITFSMKRKKLDKTAGLSAAKMEMPEDESFSELCERINERIGHERSGEKTYTDKELDLLTKIPRPLMVRGVRLLRWLDYQNLLPASFIDGDGMFTSLFIANLGSLKMGAGFHHLFEWGNCPAFVMVGQIEERPVVEDGEVVVRKILPLRWTYDERIDDGLTARDAIRAVVRILENPTDELT